MGYDELGNTAALPAAADIAVAGALLLAALVLSVLLTLPLLPLLPLLLLASLAASVMGLSVSGGVTSTDWIGPVAT